ncbi:phage holin family protein [Quadrisphaera sp. INWT6]|uniref:phage holin family protein n=1 Tax=Quadrisphaera sp. INWT6 TaxID=2596917 RepID=UPI00189231DE|nr:phage holin family protein [Quadrisphaera sp. INWT6]MBF5081883.1 phage holin family protein [Quadrisphaera sp. INWT6]
MSHTTGTTGSERTIGQLVADASRDLSALVRAEIALAKSEITAEVKQGAIGAGLFVGAAVFGGIGGLFVLLAIAWLLSLWLPTWAGFLIVAVVLLVIAGALALVGKGRISKVGKPERTISTSKQSIEALKGHH